MRNCLKGRGTGKAENHRLTRRDGCLESSWTWDFMHAKQAFYQLSVTPALNNQLCSHMTWRVIVARADDAGGIWLTSHYLSCVEMQSWHMVLSTCIGVCLHTTVQADVVEGSMSPIQWREVSIIINNKTWDWQNTFQRLEEDNFSHDLLISKTCLLPCLQIQPAAWRQCVSLLPWPFYPLLDLFPS